MTSFTRTLRSLIRSPGFTVIAVTTLAFGIGANTAMFSLLNALVVRPLPFSSSEELVRIWRVSDGTQRGGFSPADFLDLQRAGSDLGTFAAYHTTDVALSGQELPARNSRLMAVSSGLFSLLELRPQLGRSFHAAEEIHGSHHVVLLSHDLWQGSFGGREDVLGRTIRIDGEPHEIVGVLPAWATSRRPINGDVFRPLGLTDAQRTSRTTIMLNLVGRRGPDVSDEQLASFIDAFGQGLAADHPEANGNTVWRSETLLASGMNSTGRMMVFMLLGLSASVLLIACSNLANFMLARTMGRAREFAVRAALGASRWRLVVPLAWEAIIVAFAGFAAALLVSRWTTAWITAESAQYGDRPLPLPFDWRVLGFALLAALVTALVFGIAPALFAMRVNLNDMLKSGSRGSTASRGHQRLRGLLIVGQFALAMIILAGAGFFLGGTRNLLRQDFGWSADHVAQGAVDLPRNRYAAREEILAFQREATERLRALPGVTAVSFSHDLPYGGLSGGRGYVIEGRDLPPEGREPTAESNGISPDYFDVTGIRLLAGRPFTSRDNATSPRVAIISESLAGALFPEEDPLGHRIAYAGRPTPEWMEIVGVVADVRSAQSSQPSTGLQIYHPMAQASSRYSRLAVRTAGVPPETLLDPMQQVIATLDPDLPVSDLMTAEQRFERTASDLAMINTLLGAFALLALGLAALGIYGVVARTVAQRTGEFGIRLALGAQVRHVTGLVLAGGVRLALMGTGLGLLGALTLTRLLASGMPGLQTSSSAVLGSVGGALMAVALLASYLPARRAARINPVDALRSV